ncbi:MAG TPA: putative glycolipid-binding domain-containing protein [Planctomycetota bacterium]|nr:putative glycolipid-binding domain-containing protein [Planctomycetota bacterium]
MKSHSILWERLDLPGHEACALMEGRGRLELSGTAIFSHRGSPCALRYSVETAEGGRTRRARVEGIVGRHPVDIRIRADRRRRWTINGRPCPQVEGCEDVDLNFSPSTNTLPIRRLSLAVGDRASVRAAWLRFPDFTFHPLDQVYHRKSRSSYRYGSSSGFSAVVEVNSAGLVTRYGGVWKAVAGLSL